MNLKGLLMDDEFANLVPDEDEEIPEDSEDLEESTPEVPLEVLARCREYTDVEAFEELKKEAESYLRGESSVSQVREKWLALDQELAARHHYFQDGLRFQEWSEQLVITGRQIFEQFEWVQEQMARFDHGLQTS